MTVGPISGSDLPDAAHPNHGRTVAAWVTNAGISLGALVAAVGVGTATSTLVWAGSIVAVVALAAGAVLKALGLGQPRR